MDKKVLITANSEGIIVRGLEAKLKGLGIETVFVAPKVDELRRELDNTPLIIFLAEDDVEKYMEGMIYLKDFCTEKDAKIIVVAGKSNYNVVARNVGGGHILDCFERPIDMDKMLTEVSAYLVKAAQMSQKKSILIVDDDVSYMSMIMDWLKDTYRVSLVNSGVEAITWMATNKPDLVLLDYEMPITNGPQVLQMIRSSNELASTPVMFLTGKGDKESIMQVLSLKPAGYLLKTVDRNGLREALAGFFAKQLATNG